MAEISVPAWPMPIHQTKLMMAKPQATGMLMPQMPTPARTSPRDAPGRRSCSRREGDRESPIEPLTGASWTGVRTMIADLVGDRERKSWPGATIRSGSPAAVRWRSDGSSQPVSGSTPFSISGFGFRSARQIGRARPRVQVCQAGCSCAAAPSASRRSALGVVDVAEDDRLRRAGLLAGGARSRRRAMSPVLALRASIFAALMRCTQ